MYVNKYSIYCTLKPMIMKKFLIFFLCFTPYAGFSQSGPIAHWDFNGESNDVTGAGHTGHALNTIDTTGITGVPHTAYYFNGTNSIVTAANATDLNLTKYSICATIMPTGFYYGTCLTNTIFTRGKLIPGAGIYSLFFTNVINECITTDTTAEVFGSEGGPNNPVPSLSAFNYTPSIVTNKWYNIVITYDSTYWRVYVNDTLMSTVPGGSIPIGVSSDSISMGMSIYDVASGYPYNFKGIIDDIQLYNRVLSDSEISHLGDTCGTITLQPVNSIISVGGTATYTVLSSITSATYQWQQDAGTGFANLSNAGPYSGVTTNTLTVTGATAAMNNYNYRCLISNSWGCSDTTSSSTLMTNLGINYLLTNEVVLIFPNPSHHNVSIQLPYSNSKGVIQLINELGQIVSEQNINGATNSFDISALLPGYILKIRCDGQLIYKKLLKN